MIRSLVLFVHITGVLMMFAGFALEAFSVEPAVVFLMIAKPDAVVSLVVLDLALGVSTLAALPVGLKQFDFQDLARPAEHRGE